MDTFIQALIMSFREGLEGFLIISILLKFLDKTKNQTFKKQVWLGTYFGIGLSIILGLVLWSMSNYLGGLNTTAKLWESVGGFIAILFVTTFIIWMIKNTKNIIHHLNEHTKTNLTKKGILLLVVTMIAREGTEIAIFSFAGHYSLLPIVLGLLLSLLFVFLLNKSLIRVNLKTIFVITLAYLIIQAGYILGYSIHEGLSAAKNMNWIDKNSFLFIKSFNLSHTILNHKQGLLGLPLNILFGWYSKPEWLQLITQFIFTLTLFGYWYKNNSNNQLQNEKK